MTTTSGQAHARAARRGGRGAEDKYLTFVLGKEHYGLPILKVQEIIGLQEITPVPRMPPSVRGVLNLRGKVIPVFDLTVRFGMAKNADTKRTCIVVVQVAREGGPAITLGVIVDHVSEVQDIPAGDIEPPPSFGAAIDTAFIKGVGKVAKKVIMLLDIDKALSAAELAAAGAATSTAA